MVSVPAEGSVVLDAGEFETAYKLLVDGGYRAHTATATSAVMVRHRVPVWACLAACVLVPPAGVAMLVWRRYSRLEVRLETAVGDSDGSPPA